MKIVKKQRIFNTTPNILGSFNILDLLPVEEYYTESDSDDTNGSGASKIGDKVPEPPKDTQEENKPESHDVENDYYGNDIDDDMTRPENQDNREQQSSGGWSSSSMGGGSDDSQSGDEQDDSQSGDSDSNSSEDQNGSSGNSSGGQSSSGGTTQNGDNQQGGSSDGGDATDFDDDFDPNSGQGNSGKSELEKNLEESQNNMTDTAKEMNKEANGMRDDAQAGKTVHDNKNQESKESRTEQDIKDEAERLSKMARDAVEEAERLKEEQQKSNSQDSNTNQNRDDDPNINNNLENSMMSNVGLGQFTSTFKDQNLKKSWKEQLARLFKKALGQQIRFNSDLVNKRIEDAPPGREDIVPKTKKVLVLLDYSGSMGAGAFKKIINHMDIVIKEGKYSNTQFDLVLWGKQCKPSDLMAYHEKCKGKNFKNTIMKHTDPCWATYINPVLELASVKFRRHDFVIIFTDAQCMEVNDGLSSKAEGYLKKNRDRIIWALTSKQDERYVRYLDKTAKKQGRCITPTDV